jgi:hypothetical protein
LTSTITMEYPWIIKELGVIIMVFNATFNNISVISWRSFLLVEESGVHGENNRLATSHWKKLYHIMFYWVHLAWAGFKLTPSVVIGIDCKGSYKSNYHTVITTTAHQLLKIMNLDQYRKKTHNFVLGVEMLNQQ